MSLDAGGDSELIDFPSGELTVGLYAEGWAGPKCKIDVTASSSGTLTEWLVKTTGYQEVAFGVLPGEVVEALVIDCERDGGLNVVELDWVTVQNGPYEWPPIMDIAMNFDTMGYPDTGPQNVVRLSEDFDAEDGLIFAGSDVGGLAWVAPHTPDPDVASPADPPEWRMVNGREEELVNRTDRYVADVYATWGGTTAVVGPRASGTPANTTSTSSPGGRTPAAVASTSRKTSSARHPTRSPGQR